MRDDRKFVDHYASGELLARLKKALAGDGADPDRPTAEQLEPYEHFHTRALEATQEAGSRMPVSVGDHLLDIGSGLGGPARYFARRFACRVTGVDLTPEFCEVATHLTRLMGLEQKVAFEVGNALQLRFPEATFHGAYSMNVSMNIADKAALYRGAHRVLKPGGWLLLSEIARGAGPPPDFPTPWAATAAASFLSSPEETQRGLELAGFTVELVKSTAQAAVEYGKRVRALLDRGEKSPARAVALVHGPLAQQAAANSARAIADGRVVPIEVFARKPAR